MKDLDFAQNLLFVRAGKGDKDRATLLPKRLREFSNKAESPLDRLG